jgi:HlyD family secretion protein
VTTVTKNLRRLIVGAAALVLGGAAIAALRSGPMEVDTARVVPGQLMTTIDEEGRARIRNRYVIGAPVNGRLARITLREGDSVKAGVVVAELAPAPLDARGRDEARAHLEAALDLERTARAEVDEARAALGQAARSRERAEALSRRGVIAPEERERAELAETSRREELTAADFRARAAAHDVEAARAALTGPSSATTGPLMRIPVRAPASGTVLRVLEQSERVLPAGTPLLEVGSRRDLEVTADVLSEDAVKVNVGDTIIVAATGQDRELRAVVTLVEPAAFTKVSALGVEEQRVNIVGRFVDNPGRLGDRYRVEVRVVIWQGRVLRMPASALFRRDQRWHVFVILDGRARLRPVQVGHRGGTDVEIVSGLAEGDLVIRHPGDQLTEGARVKPRSDQPES